MSRRRWPLPGQAHLPPLARGRGEYAVEDSRQRGRCLGCRLIKTGTPAADNLEFLIMNLSPLSNRRYPLREWLASKLASTVGPSRSSRAPSALTTSFLSNVVVRELSLDEALRECHRAGVAPFWPMERKSAGTRG